jgi:hypothetical protein
LITAASVQWTAAASRRYPVAPTIIPGPDDARLLADAIALAEEERSTTMRSSGFNDSTHSYNTSLTTYHLIHCVLSHIAYNFAEHIMIKLEMAASYRDSSQSIRPILEGRNGWHCTT